MPLIQVDLRILSLWTFFIKLIETKLLQILCFVPHPNQTTPLLHFAHEWTFSFNAGETLTYSEVQVYLLITVIEPRFTDGLYRPTWQMSDETKGREVISDFTKRFGKKPEIKMCQHYIRFILVFLVAVEAWTGTCPNLSFPFGELPGETVQPRIYRTKDVSKVLSWEVVGNSCIYFRNFAKTTYLSNESKQLPDSCL